MHKSIGLGFRPLAGINCNPGLFADWDEAAGFRPLAGINCNSHNFPTVESWLFPSPRGDKLQFKGYCYSP